jgi:serine/threonine protein kinase
MAAKLKPGTLFADRYEILECLGRGGMGTVYSAQHCALAKKFAIKLLHRDLCVNSNALTRFAQEARSASGIEHQNIIDVLDAGKIGGHAFYVMEYLKGEDLQTLFTRETPLPWARVQRITLQICDAMQAAHDRRIVHRDLKPSNLYRITRGTNSDFIKILDFGIAKVRTADGKTRDELTEVGSILGTLKYMAPEQALGLKIDHRSDIYSVGVIMYQALTGELPFKGNHPGELLQRITNEVPTPMHEYVEGLPVAVELLVLKALARDPSERFPSMHSLATAIERLGLDEPMILRRVARPRDEPDCESFDVFLDSRPLEDLGEATVELHAPAPIHAPPAPHAPPPGIDVRPADEVATQTGGPRGRRSHLWGTAASCLAVILAVYVTAPTRAEPPVGRAEVAPQVETAPVPTSPSPPERAPPKAADPPATPPSAEATPRPAPEEPARVESRPARHPPRARPAPAKLPAEPEVDCNTIREETLAAVKDEAWERVYERMWSPCWTGDPRTVPWKLRELRDNKRYDECVELGNSAKDPGSVDLVNECRAHALGLMPVRAARGGSS